MKSKESLLNTLDKLDKEEKGCSDCPLFNEDCEGKTCEEVVDNYLKENTNK